MNWFTEKFMEDCIAETPEVFMGRPMQLESQQPKLGGFIPDLIFSDPSGTKIIVEVQKFALDRRHLYKCLEYRDLLATEDGGKRPIVALVCEALPEKYQSIIATHNIEVYTLDREQFIERAITYCPRSLKKHLVRSIADEPDLQTTLTQPKIRRYGWNHLDTLTEIYDFAIQELAQCKDWPDLQKQFENDSVLWNARFVLEERHVFSDLLDPTEWRIDNLIAKPTRWVPPHLAELTRIRKPKAFFEVFETSKNNLSVRWYPKNETPWENSLHDWVEAPSTEPYAYQRPANELLFIKDIRSFDPQPNSYIWRADGEERAALDTISLGLIWAMIKHIQKRLSATVELDVLSEFELLVDKPTETDSLNQRHDIIGWRVISTSALQAEQAQQRILSFSNQHGIDVSIVLQALEGKLKQPNTSKGDLPTYLAKALRTQGYKTTAAPIRQLLDDLKTAKHPEYCKLTASDNPAA